MSCEKCKNIEERFDVPHVIRTCEGCGRKLHIARYGEFGRGIKVEKGEQFVIPKGWLKLSANPLKGKSNFTFSGLQWFAKLIFVSGLPEKAKEYIEEVSILEREMDRIVNESPLINDLDVNNEEDIKEMIKILEKNRNSKEYWAFWTSLFLSMAKKYQSDEKAESASWATACAERCRAMVVFKEHLEEVVWMGHSARRIVDVLKTWEDNNTVDSERFWQKTFKNNSFILSQVFAVPVVFINENAYVGGMKVDRHEAKFVDYLFSAESSQEAILIEIKTPVTKLLGSEYRKNTFAPSKELSGAVIQVLSYRKELMNNLNKIAGEKNIKAFSPKCVLIIGDSRNELDDENKRSSFELFRASLDVEIITYDELFRKVEILAELFSIKKNKSDKT